MKKILFSILALATVSMAYAQTPFALSGTTYTQTFDNIASGLPLGWRVDSLVNKNAGLGNDAITRFSTTAVAWSNTGRGFKNIASADGLTAGATSIDQSASTDRALGIRQVSAAGWDDKDSLVSASFNIANTVGLSNFTMSVKLQSLHTTAKRYHNWIVQYGIGSSPATFTTISTAPAVVTLDSNFSNTTVSVNFGSALDNVAQPVWIRLMPSDTTMGSGNRPAVGIDDFELTWTGTAVNNTPQVLSYTPASGTMNVPTTTTSLAINFDKNITIGNGNVTVNNITDATNQVIPAANCTAAGMNVSIPGVNLLAGKQYAVQYDSTCFKNGTYSCYGVYNNSTWTFSTQPPVLPPVTSLNESFVGCNAPMLGSFMDFSVSGTQTWRCSNFGRNDTDAVYMNGFAGGSTQDNEDWLISPPLDMSAMTNPNLHFWSKIRFSGNNTKEVYVSSNFMGDPNTATWINLNPALGTLDTTWKFYNNLNLTSYKATPFNIGFKYVSVSTGTADEWSIDDVYITDGPVGVQTFEQAGLKVIVLGNASDKLNLQIVDQDAKNYQLSIMDLNGRVLLRETIHTLTGKNNYTFTMPAIADGLYIINLKNEHVNGNLKFVKQ
jgi:hypothetical protein